MAGIGVEYFTVDDRFAEGDNGFALGEAAQAVVAGAGAELYAGLLGVVIGAKLGPARHLEARHFGNERTADCFFEEVFRFGRVFELAENFDVTVGGDGVGFLTHAFFHGGQVLPREHEAKPERARLRRHHGHAFGGIIADLVEDGHERGRGMRGLVLDDGFAGAFHRCAERRAHHALHRRGHDFTEVGDFLAGFFQRRNKHDQNAAIQNHVHHVDVGGLGVEDVAVVVAERLQRARELHGKVAVLLAGGGGVVLRRVRAGRFHVALIIISVAYKAGQGAEIALEARADLGGDGFVALEFDDVVDAEVVADRAHGQRDVLIVALPDHHRHHRADKRYGAFLPHRVVALRIRHQRNQHIDKVRGRAGRKRVHGVGRGANIRVARHVVQHQQIVVAPEAPHKGGEIRPQIGIGLAVDIDEAGAPGHRVGGHRGEAYCFTGTGGAEVENMCTCIGVGEPDFFVGFIDVAEVEDALGLAAFAGTFVVFVFVF